MGQKIHPGGFRIGIIHDWKSNWFSEKEFGAYLIEDVRDPRSHPRQALARRALGHPHPQGLPADHDRHLHRAPGHRDRQVRQRGRGAAPGRARHDPQGRARQHQRDQAARAGRQPGRPVRRRAAAEPRLVPARHEALAGLGHALGRPGRAHPLRRPPRRRGDVAHRAVLGGPRAAAHAARGHRLRLRRGPDPGRPHRRQGLDQQGRDHARRLRGRPAADDAPGRGRRAPPSRRHDDHRGHRPVQARARPSPRWRRWRPGWRRRRPVRRWRRRRRRSPRWRRRPSRRRWRRSRSADRPVRPLDARRAPRARSLCAPGGRSAPAAPVEAPVDAPAPEAPAPEAPATPTEGEA